MKKKNASRIYLIIQQQKRSQHVTSPFLIFSIFSIIIYDRYRSNSPRIPAISRLMHFFLKKCVMDYDREKKKIFFPEAVKFFYRDARH